MPPSCGIEDMAGPCGLYAITPDEPDTTRLVVRANEALAGGTRWLQYRNKQADRCLARVQATALLALTRAHGGYLIVNDDADLALEIAADGVHLGREDGGKTSFAAIRARSQLLPHRFFIGVSCYDQLPLAEAASRAGADYLAFGSFFASPTKPLAVRAETALLVAARARWPVPIVAIGGITLENAPQLIAAGAHALAVISNLFAAADISAVARRYQQLFHSHVCNQPKTL